MTTNVHTNLSAVVREGDVPDPLDVMRQIHSGKSEGQFRTLNLCPQGLVFKRGGKITGFIPHDELWKLEGGPALDPAKK